MRKNLECGFNDLWPTTLYQNEFEVDDDIIHCAMQKKVSPRIHELAKTHFELYLNEVLDISFADYKDYKFLSWVNRYENSEMEYHTHNGSQLSAVYYPVVEGAGGEITFYDPRFFAARGYDMKFRKLYEPVEIKPYSGLFVIFPSFLYHSVKLSTGFKLSIPVDLFLYSDT